MQFHVTRYGPGVSYLMTRAWITWDGVELVNMSTAEWFKHYYGLAQQIREINACEDFRNPDQREGYNLAYDLAEDTVKQHSIYSRDNFYDALEEYVNLSLDAALQSANSIIKAIAMFDRRLGKRRLAKIVMSDSENRLVKEFYRLRCIAEGV